MSLFYIEKRLSELIPDQKDPLFQAARYSLLAPGKRLRPQLVLAAAELSPKSIALDPACAIEMIHTYSLIHDDLPCMDDDDLRRGRPTLHKVFGEGMALLAGDYLLTYAFEVLTKAPGLSVEQKMDMIQTLSKHAGSGGMIGGQAIDITSQGKVIDETTLEKMHIGKTASLLIACLEFGAILSKASLEKRELMREIGRDAGLAYQILDDILDETSSTGELGKTAGSDAARGKPTAVSIYTLKGAKERLNELKTTSLEKAAKLSKPLNELLQKLFDRSK